MYKYLLIIALLFYFNTIQAQEKYTISGYVKDASTGEALIDANVYIEKLKAGSATNVYGFYSVTVTEGRYTVKYSYIGYKTQEIKISLNKNIKQNIELTGKR